MVSLAPKPGFDWTRVSWGGPDQVQSDSCSYCDANIPADAVPLRLWNADGWAAVFCDPCAAAWFGLRTEGSGML